MPTQTNTPRLPHNSDFDPNLVFSVVPPPASQPTTNILILFHGLGDTHQSFTTLARNLALPETACLVLRAPTPLPFDLGGFHWGDDIIFDQASGAMEYDTGFEKSLRVLREDVIQRALLDKCGFRKREILFFGFGQGGMLGLALAAQQDDDSEFGGVISVGGPLPSSIHPARKSHTPVLVLGGSSSSSLVSQAAVARLNDTFEFVWYFQWRKPGDGMPTNREEMMPIMQFFGRRLRSRKGVPDDAIEVS